MNRRVAKNMLWKNKKFVTEKELLVDQTNGYQNANVIGWKYLH